MNETPQTQGDDAEAEDGRQADAMKAQLKRDVEVVVQDAQRIIRGSYR